MIVRQSRQTISRAFLRFVRTESAGGIVMMVAAAIALLLANTPAREAYESAWHTYAGLTVGEWSLKMSLLHWINDGLMAVFFLLVGLEIKREILFGELASFDRAILPVVGAVGGAALPALLFLGLNAGGPHEHGWGIPMATDIAFAVAILALLGRHAPLWLKTFVIALAIADDILAVLVIAVFYSASLDTTALLGAGLLLLLLLGLNRLDVQRPGLYVVPMLLLWYAVLQSGVHATIAGVAAAAFIPASHRRSQKELTSSMSVRVGSLEPTPVKEEWQATDVREEALAEIAHEATSSSAALYRVEHAVHAWVAFLILPLFAFANAGIPIPRVNPGEVYGHPLTLGIIIGLLAGKQAGITGSVWLAVKFGIGRLAPEARWRELWAGSLLAAIGFTMSIFVASLAFSDPETLGLAKIGILTASLIAAVAGAVALRAGRPAEQDTVRDPTGTG